ncbi:AAA family ATPase [Sabulicella glaciei]|nr:AAA family ATPase [Roseococcus sp. MDT2-1-1]
MLPWLEIDRGAVLVGPPGTGKTSLARAVAASAGLPLVASSLQQWQGARDGHLGTLLGAMQATFTQARRAAPSILLIDEIDSFTARTELPAHHRDYSTQVVNGLLELLDGALSREGVVVLGTCNDATHLDPAILRPGRLERLLAVPLPDHAGLVALLRQAAAPLHFAPEEVEALAVAALGRRATGAAVELWARDARRRARAERRPLAVADFQAAIGPPPPPWPEDDLLRIALHEAGHAVVAAVLEPDLLGDTRLAREPAELGDEGVRGFVAWRLDDALAQPLVLTSPRLRRLLAIKLGGRAAEALALGEVSAGAGGGEGSDLALATATTARAVMMDGLGTPSRGHELVWLGRHGRREMIDALRSDPALWQVVAAELHVAHALALDTLAPHQTALQHLAQQLREKGRLSAEDVQRAIATPGRGGGERQTIPPASAAAGGALEE